MINTSLSKCFLLSLCVLNCVSCVNYRVTPKGQELLDSLDSISRKRDAKLFCETVKKGVDYAPHGEGMRWSPEAFYYYGDCHAEGWSGNPPDLSIAKDYLTRSAKCGESKAKQALGKYGWNVPEQECEIGKRFYFCGTSCGMSSEYTPLGLVVGGPFLLVGGVVLTAAALLTLPVCAITVPFHGNRCM